MIDRMWFALISIIAILIPLARMVPPIYQFRIRSRIFRWYRNLRQIEDDMERKSVPSDDLLTQLDKLDAQAAKVMVPLAYTDELYALRSAIDMVRKRLRNSAAPA